MAILVWDAKDFGIKSHPEVTANYASVEDAIRQAEHDLSRGRHPLRVEDDGEVVWMPEN